MPMVAAVLQKQMENTLKNALKKEFAKEAKGNDKADEANERMAKAIASIAKDIVEFIQANGQAVTDKGPAPIV